MTANIWPLNSPPPPANYRADIDGLRAIAVLSVVGFHAFPEFMPGGFIGVDIFFVISGFLISTIIFHGLTNRSFSFADFYLRRVRRIFPALVLVLSSSLVFGWFTLLANEYGQLGEHIAAGAGFASNLLLWGESSYFDNAADTKPLLHLWSLGIEEQFYLFLPVLLWAASKLRVHLLSITVTLLVISFTLNVYGIKDNVVSTFYSPQTRFWELLSGSLLAWLILHNKPLQTVFVTKHQNSISFIGTALIVVGISIIGKNSTFPGWLASLPVVGSFLIILVGPTSWVNRCLLSNRFLVWVGLISFPLYLWHWPILSFARILSSEVPTAAIRVALVSLSFLFAWLTFELIEKPLRFGPKLRIKSLALIVVMAIVGLVGCNVYQRNGLKFRTVVKINALSDSGKDGGVMGIPISACTLFDATGAKLSATCITDDREKPKFALIGDSKALAIHEALMRTSKPGGRWVLIGSGKEGVFVPTISEMAFDSRVYLPYTAAAINFILSQDIEKVAIVSSTRMLFGYDSDKSLEDFPNNTNYPLVLIGLYKTLDELTKAGKKVVLVVDNPTLLDPKDCMNRQTSLDAINKLLPRQNPAGCSVSVSKHLEYSAQYRKLLFELESKFSGRVKVFDTVNYLCEVSKDICMPSKDSRLMYSYSDHISDYAAGLIGADLNDLLLTY